MKVGHLKGIVEEVGTRGRVKVRLPELDNLVTDWLPVGQSLTLGARAWRVPRKGTQVVVLPGLNLDDAVVLCGLYSQADPPPFDDAGIIGLEADDGTVFQYDPSSRVLKISKPDSIEVETTLFKVTGKTELSGDLAVSGKTELASELDVQGETTLASTLTVAGKDFATHTHPGVTSGSSVTGPVS